MDAVMTQIIQRGETIDNQDAGRSANAAGLANSNGTFPLRASDQLKIQSLQILENLVSLLF